LRTACRISCAWALHICSLSSHGNMAWQPKFLGSVYLQATYAVPVCPSHDCVRTAAGAGTGRFIQYGWVPTQPQATKTKQRGSVRVVEGCWAWAWPTWPGRGLSVFFSSEKKTYIVVAGTPQNKMQIHKWRFFFFFKVSFTTSWVVVQKRERER
jgi:hypothetical protein